MSEEVPELSSSWPGVASRGFRSEPPRPPHRKPSDADWEVPPLELPMKQRKGAGSMDECSTTTTASCVLNTEMEAEGEYDHDDEEACTFSFDVAVPEDQDLVDIAEDNVLVNFTDMSSPSSFRKSSPMRIRSASMSPALGASPVLLSALERVAAEAGMHLGRRNRFETM